MLRRPFLVIAVLLVVVAAATVAFRTRNGDAIEVTVEAAARQPIFRSTVAASGEIVATRYADIGSSIMGKIVSLPVTEGDEVREGQVLARIDPVQARADLAATEALTAAQLAEAAGAERQIASAEAEVKVAEARAREAQLTLARTRELHAQALAPRADLDTAQASADTAAAQVAAARAALERVKNVLGASRQRVTQARAQTTRARDMLQKTEITSPMSGVVSRLQVREGEMVVIGIQNQPGTTLMTVSDLSSINAEVKVAEADVLRLQVNQPATVTLEAIPSRRFSGKVVEIGTSALPVIGTAAAAREFRVVVRLDQADAALRPGLTCDADILVSERKNVLTVPLQSVVLRPVAGNAQGPAADAGGNSGGHTATDRPGVFVVEDSRARFRPVTPGIIGGLLIEVDGIAAGTPVLTGPFQALRELQEGARVRIRARETR